MKAFLNLTAAVLLLWGSCAMASPPVLEKIHFLIPGGRGGGWDTTARETGQALVKTGLVKQVTFENLSGAGGGRALMSLIEGSHEETLMVQSTPLILRNLTGTIRQSFRDITPVSLLIAEYQVLAVPADSPYTSVNALLNAIEEDPIKNGILGGSPKGSLDHVTTALMLKEAGIPIDEARYLPNDGGGDALKRLYGKVGVALVTGYGEVAKEYEAGKLRLLGITSEQRLPDLNVPTMKEQGLDMVFINWRGFFAKPDLPKDRYLAYRNMLVTLTTTKAWQEIREKYGWDHFVKTDQALLQFLENQEREMKEVLSTLELYSS